MVIKKMTSHYGRSTLKKNSNLKRRERLKILSSPPGFELGSLNPEPYDIPMCHHGSLALNPIIF